MRLNIITEQEIYIFIPLSTKQIYPGLQWAIIKKEETFSFPGMPSDETQTFIESFYSITVTEDSVINMTLCNLPRIRLKKYNWLWASWL